MHMCMHMTTCMHMCIHMHMHIHVTCACACMHMCMHMHMNACACRWSWACHMAAHLDAGRRMRRIHPQLAQAEGQRLARGVIREMVHDTRDGAPEEVEARAEMQEGAGMGARGRGRCALGMLGAVDARRRGVIRSGTGWGVISSGASRWAAWVRALSPCLA